MQRDELQAHEFAVRNVLHERDERETRAETRVVHLRRSARTYYVNRYTARRALVNRYTARRALAEAARRALAGKRPPRARDFPVRTIHPKHHRVASVRFDRGHLRDARKGKVSEQSKRFASSRRRRSPGSALAKTASTPFSFPNTRARRARVLSTTVIPRTVRSRPSRISFHAFAFAQGTCCPPRTPPRAFFFRRVTHLSPLVYRTHGASKNVDAAKPPTRAPLRRDARRASLTTTRSRATRPC